MSNRKLEFANFVCRFGDAAVLADQLDTVVLPAFTNPYERNYRNTSVFLHGVEILNPSDNRHIVAGRIIKDTILVRRTLFNRKTGELVEDPETLRSSPSAFFVLVLESHRLFYVRESAGAPSLDQFRSTMQRFLTNAYLDYQANTVDKKTNELPEPVLDIVPVLSVSSLKTLIQRFDRIEHLRVHLAEVNNQTDNSTFIRKLRSSKKSLNAKKTSVDYRSSDGLDKEQVSKEINAIKDGTGSAVIEGKDKNGVKLRADQKNLSVQVPIADLPRDTEHAAEQVLEEIENLIEIESFSEGKIEKGVPAKIRRAIERLN